MSDDARPSLPSSLVGSVLGRYRLERLLGEGGMGVVYAARHQDLGKLAAVKILHERHDGAEHVRVRFLREGQAVSRIRHPNIVDVYDVGSEAGRVYLVMELLEGEDLRSLLAREGPLSPQRTTDLLLPVIAAVAAAHDLGVVHRDLKPDNIFLSSERNSIRPKVLDFGISKVADPEKLASLTGTGTLLGTPYYMSPEQAQTDKNVDARSDQYSLGVIVYECVTGRRPVEEPALYQLIHRIVQGDFPAPRQVNPAISAVFEHVILRAMAKSPADRFPTTRALGCALLQFASERVRANYADELAHDERPIASVAPATPALNLADGLRTTLGESVHERDSSRQPAKKRNLTLPLVGGMLLAGIGGTVAWRLSLPQASGPPESSAAALPPAVTPAAPLTTPPRPSADEVLPSPSAETNPSVAAADAGEPAPSASVVRSQVGAAPKSPVTKRLPKSDRPELAPR